MVGKPADHLRKILDKFGFDLDQDGVKTNAIICRPPSNRKPTGAEVGFCRPNLTRVIKELKPHTIVPMGGAAVQAVLGDLWREDPGKIGRWVGWKIPNQKHNAWICPTWHPSHLLHQDDRTLDRMFENHLEIVADTFGRPWPQGPPDYPKAVQRMDPAEAAVWLRALAKRDVGAIAWDYETNMLKPDGPHARIVSCAVTYGVLEPVRTVAFAWVGDAIAAMGELLRSPIPKIGANLKFEDRWTRVAFRHRVRNWVWDVVHAAHVLDNRPGITSVKFQAFTRLGAPTYSDHITPFLKTKGNEVVNRILREISMRDLLLYNGLDALLEWLVCVDQVKQMGGSLPWRTL